MNNKIKYPYAAGELLEQPNTYFYSAYKGLGFVSAWQQSRADCLAALESAGNFSDEQLQVDATPTGQYLKKLIASFDTEELLEEDRKNLDALLRNFEAKKRIYEDYHPGFTSKDRSDYHELGLYVRFAEMMALSFNKWEELPYLNAMIKCIDILCAMRQELSLNEKRKLAEIIEAEAEFVAKLALQLGVSI